MVSSRLPGIGASCVPAMVHRYRFGSGKEHLEKNDDVARVVRIEGRVYPLGAYLLSKIRMELGIPAKHCERLSSDKYRAYDEKVYREIGEPAVIDHEKGDAIIQKIKGRLQANIRRSQEV